MPVQRTEGRFPADESPAGSEHLNPFYSIAKYRKLASLSGPRLTGSAAGALPTSPATWFGLQMPMTTARSRHSPLPS
jgi:hypothetical protein